MKIERAHVLPIADILLLVVAVAWGGSYLAAKELVSSVGFDVALALRYMVAAAGMIVFLTLRNGSRIGSRLLLVGGLLGLSQAAVLGLETAGVGLTSSTNAGLLISLSLLFTPLLEMFVMGRYLPPTFYLVTIAAIFGTALLVSPNGMRLPGLGDLLVLAAALVRAGHVTATAKLMRPNDDVPTLIAIQMVIGSLLFTGITWPRLGPAVTSMGLPEWGEVLYLGLMCSVFAFLVQAWAIGRSSAARAAMLMGTEPVWALVIGVTLGGELLGPVQILGALVLIVATTLGARIERRARERREAI